ncbi:hypothetical protein [Bifidobacterium biavatii]|uniref:hypothetical protein n=1 Tax=Bifidobacterium biavatii TaxID=762212 RepID=UPI00126A0753|nr:hypothetical protein [Bifidobacterium biavatii]
MTSTEFLQMFDENNARKAKGDHSETSWDKAYGRYSDASDPQYDAKQGALWQSCSTDPIHH